MRKRISPSIILLSTFLFLSCESHKFIQTVSFAVDKDYVIEINEPIELDMLLTRQDIISQLNFPEVMRVTKVSIESISGTLSPNTSNKASYFHSSGNIVKPNGKVQAWNSENGFLPLPFPVVQPVFNIANSAIEEGINELANQIFEVLSELGDTSTLEIKITVKPEAGKLLAINANFKIVASVEYEYC
ncbi:hypothetical protein KC799_18890, partial [candidate division KSB1 bacterium]|nr:hypothetical protein [candidate division KSB1 bacterium]